MKHKRPPALLLADQGRHAEAIPLLEKELEKDPNNPYIAAGLAISYRGVGDKERALRYFKKITGSDPQASVQAFIEQMVILSELGRNGEYRDTLLRAFRRYPHHPQITYHMALIEQKDGNFEAALELYERTVRADDNFWQAYNNVGVMQRDSGQLLEAEANFKTAFAISEEEIVGRNISDLWVRGIPETTDDDFHLIDMIDRSFIEAYGYRGAVTDHANMFFSHLYGEATSGLTVDNRFAVVSRVTNVNPVQPIRDMMARTAKAMGGILGRPTLANSKIVEYDDLESLFQTEIIRSLRGDSKFGILRILPVNRFIETGLTNIRESIQPVEICKYKAPGVLKPIRPRGN